MIVAGLNYASAFNMVGWNFIFPGQYTFGVVCIACLLIMTLAALSWIAHATTSEFLVAIGGGSFALLTVFLVIETGAIAVKDYFIFGLPIAVAAGGCSVTIAIRQVRALWSVSMRTMFVRASLFWGFACSLAAAGILLGTSSDANTYMRQQIYLLTASIPASVAIIKAAKAALVKAGRGGPFVPG